MISTEKARPSKIELRQRKAILFRTLTETVRELRDVDRELNRPKKDREEEQASF